jgi:hypothetical protein
MKKLTKIAIVKRICIIILITLIVGTNNAPAQVKYQPERKFKNGIYLNFEQVLNNTPVPQTKLTGFNNFYLPKTLIDNKLDSLDNNGNKKRIRCPKIFFFGFNGNLTPYFRGNSGKWIIFGRISIFSVHIDRLFRGYITDHFKEYDPMYNLEVWRTKQYAVNKQSYEDIYLLDFNSGKVVKFNYEKLTSILKTDLNLYQEYINLNRPTRKGKAIDFITKFNFKYPIYSTQK